MKTRYTLMLGLFVLLATGGALYLQQYAEARGSKPKPIDFTLTDTDGKKVKLSDYHGKVVLVDFWATWCGYCVREIPDLIAVQEAAVKEKTPLQIIGISVDRDRGIVKSFAKDHGINYPILYAEAAAVKPFGDIPGFPTKFIINDKGVVVEKIIGARPKAELEKTLAKYLPKKK